MLTVLRSGLAILLGYSVLQMVGGHRAHESATDTSLQQHAALAAPSVASLSSISGSVPSGRVTSVVAVVGQVLRRLPKLKKLDGQAIDPEEREAAAAKKC